jgi:hypothetical protein
VYEGEAVVGHVVHVRQAAEAAGHEISLTMSCHSYCVYVSWEEAEEGV